MSDTLPNPIPNLAQAIPSRVGSTGAANTSLLTFDRVDDAARWERLLEQADRAHSVQVFGYGEAKASKGWRVSRQLLSSQGRPVAIVQALEKRVLGLRVVTRINRGPMFLMPDPPAHLVTAVYRAVRNRWGRLPFGILLLAPALEDKPENRVIMADAGFRPRKGNGWGSARLDLTQPIEAVFQSFEHNWRKAIRAADKAGVSVRVVDTEADHEWMIERHLQNMAVKGFHGHDAAFLRSLRRSSGSNYVLLQAMHEGRPVAGLVMLKFGSIADSIVAWFGDEGRKVKAGNAITWGAIQEMQRRGCLQYDVGGINSDKGFSSFKSGMNGEKYFLLGEYVAF
ncbi:GNAT family N-acetyltransferase [Devosia sp. ZB163]|uniref:lipid II:glycine glycyltransferase FemX n=1 Tax=Devosia sp. ZB163 TaxID=3025938 RepID=UPI00235E276E|nr:GNAT family N-acetyltransferase [Devosia sp. ZB163]MDC9826312.1 GNAT family N-acetyltransferase [Devosia sp. ZB163]